jgi:hypothetical protein
MSVHYKFKSAKDYDTVTFDGAFISVAELKREIIAQKKLTANGNDLLLENAQTTEGACALRYIRARGEFSTDKKLFLTQTKNIYTCTQYAHASTRKHTQTCATHVLFGSLTRPSLVEYAGDATMIPKNTSIIVKRIPGQRTAQDAPASAAAPVTLAAATAAIGFPSSSDKSLSESDRLNALLSQGVTYTETRRQRNTSYSRPPNDYICRRCQKPGHFIQNCPTNGDATFDAPKVKKATGIPLSMLRKTADVADKGTLALPGGGYAVMQPNE